MLDPAIALRSTTESDWPLLRSLRLENAAENPISYGATLETTRAMTEDDWRMRARRGDVPDAASVVASHRDTGRWIGMMSGIAGDDDDADPVLTGVYVTPEYRGRRFGVADALLDEIVAWAEPRAPRLRLYVYEHATPATKFYVRRGFTPTGRTRPLGFTKGQTLEMELALRSV